MMELSEVLVLKEEDKQFSVRDAISEIRQMAIDALTYVKRYVAGGTLVALLMWGSYQQSAGSVALIDKAPLEVVVDNGLQQPEVLSTAYYYQYDRFAQKIVQLGQLHDGWDGNGALAPSPVSLESIGIIVNSLPKSVLMHCALFPANDAGVYLQGRFQEWKLSVYVHKTQMTYIAKTAERREAMKNIAVNEESATHLSEMVSMLFA